MLCPVFKMYLYKPHIHLLININMITEEIPLAVMTSHFITQSILVKGAIFCGCVGVNTTN